MCSCKPLYKINIDIFQQPGSGLLIMALEMCNALVSHDINGALVMFTDLTVELFPGENIL
jgi:hypothetical protein